jgi:hypothetical protein
MAGKKYRKRHDHDSWHWCRNCTNWPTSNYTESDTAGSGEKCNECLAKERNGDCRSS